MEIFRHILIDGYNVIHSKFRIKSLITNSQDKARNELINLAHIIYSTESTKITLVFDSNKDKLEIEYPLKVKSFACVFAPISLSADGVIEQILVNSKNNDLITVVTNDNLIKESTRVNGSNLMTPEDFYNWSEFCKKRLVKIKSKIQNTNDEKFGNKIDLE